MSAAAVSAESLGKTFLHTLPRSRTFLGQLRRMAGGQGPALQVRALRDVNFRVAQGECLGITGPNGAGKSTLLALVAGILSPTSGRITVQGRTNTIFKIQSGLQAELSVRDNIEICGILMGLRRREALDKLESILDFAELQRYADVRLAELSTGQAARVAFSTAMHSDLDILLIDELLAVGDAAFREKCIDALVRLNRAGKTLLLVSHEPEYVQRLCSQVLELCCETPHD